MLCPNCNKQMEEKSHAVEIPDFSGTSDYPLERYIESHKCKACKIVYKNGEWNIPDNLKPTDKQAKTIKFIENRLGYCGDSLTKKQAWSVINRNFDKAKQTPLHDDQYYLDMQEYFGYNEGDFC